MSSRSATIAVLIACLQASAVGSQPTAEPPAKSAVEQVSRFVARAEESGGLDRSAIDWKASLPPPPTLVFESGDDHLWELETNHGTVIIRLLTDVAPRHAANALYLSELGFYEGLEFHRVISGFMVQGGALVTDGWDPGPGFEVPQEIEPRLKMNRRGLVAMVNEKDVTHGSQFFITLAPTPWLDGENTVFGEVVGGEDTLTALEQRGSEEGVVSEPLRIERSRVVSRPSAVDKARQHAAELERSGELDRRAPDWKTKIPEPPELGVLPGKSYVWTLETTEGDIAVRLLPEAAPRHVTSVLHLSALGYYDGYYFHRVVPGFMAQGGGSQADRAGPGAGYVVPDEISKKATHDRPWRVCSFGSEFYITFDRTSWLDGESTIFGQVLDGFDTLERIELLGSEEGGTRKPIEIRRATVSDMGTFLPATDRAGEQLAAFIEKRTAEGEIDRSVEGWDTKLPFPPELDFERGRTYFWHLQTNQGPIRLRLRPDVAPIHVSSLLYLSKLGFYDGLTFQRVIPGFMAQGGWHPNGGPGYNLEKELDPEVRHEGAGVLSFANVADRPVSENSGFFITFGATHWLDMKHTIAGEVVDGMETVRALEQRGTAGAGEPTELLSILSARVTVE